MSGRGYSPAHVGDPLKARISFRLSIGDLVGEVSEPAVGFNPRQKEGLGAGSDLEL